MSNLEIVDEVVNHSPRPAAAAGRPARGILNESITIGSSEAHRDDSGGGTEDKIQLGSRAGRTFSANAQRMLANIDKHNTVDDEPADTQADDTPPAETKPEPAAAAAPATEAAKPADPAPDVLAEHKAANERLTARNRELIAEVEKLKGGSTGKREPSAREKGLDEAERMYVDDPAGAVRRFLAVVTGQEDPAHKDVDAEMAGLYQDLTAKELGVSLDDSKQAQREAARIRLTLAREKRERKAEQDAATKPKDDPEATEAASAHQIIGNRLSFKQSDGASLAERFPLTMKFAERISGHKPEALIWDAIKRGVKSGEIDPQTPNDKLIEIAITHLEPHYQALADELVEARKPTSTAKPTPAATEKANNERDKVTGTRTITSASASVAPATPPATASEQAKSDDKPKPAYRNERERRAALARRHAGES